MLLVIYNSDPTGVKPNPSRGWALYSHTEWGLLCEYVQTHFSSMGTPLVYAPEGKSPVYYRTYQEWLADYQISVISDIAAQRLGMLADTWFVDMLLGTSFYVPDLTDDPVYAEMDAYA